MTWVSRIVRLGYLAKGVIYTLIGVLAIRVAFGMRGGRLTEPTGVLLQILRQPLGRVILTIIGIGIVGYAAYYLFEAIADLRRKGGGFRGWRDRSMTIIKAVAYGTMGIQALMIVFFDGRPRGNPEDQARAVMQFPLGAVLLFLIGVGIAIYGFTQLKVAWHGHVDEDIDAARVRREASWVLPLGRAGAAARGVILMMMGPALASSAFRGKPSDADGYREVLASLAAVNPWLLAAVGGGLLCFGVYQLCHARYAKLAVR
ncbi:MAG TPA: DUF1206 domain-containing protein [Vicinamibacterales bacterium]|nr:DUF1206 domain-containing protein [Vicinamibacterales bacterium]